ncbi:MAG: hypothetical protein ABI658_32945 [Acidimicrobiales bacterium]
MNVSQAPRLLESFEEDYSRHVAWHLRDIEVGQRRELLDEVRAHLRDRPRPDSEQSLWDELGPPTRYVSELRGVHELGSERTDWWARWLAISSRCRWTRLVATSVTVALVVAGAATLRWWVTWQTEMTPVSYGVLFESNGVIDSSDFSGIEQVERFESRSVEVDLSDRREVVLKIGMLMGRTPRRVTIPVLEQRAAETPSVVVVSSMITPQFGTGPKGVEQIPGYYNVEFHLRANCASAAASLGPYAATVGSARVEYEAFGRSRTAEIQLLATVQFSWSDPRCPN